MISFPTKGRRLRRRRKIKREPMPRLDLLANGGAVSELMPATHRSLREVLTVMGTAAVFVAFFGMLLGVWVATGGGI